MTNLEPVFVASLTIGDYVYFFMRETSIEYMNCGQVSIIDMPFLNKAPFNLDNFMFITKTRLSLSLFKLYIFNFSRNNKMLDNLLESGANMQIRPGSGELRHLAIVWEGASELFHTGRIQVEL